MALFFCFGLLVGVFVFLLIVAVLVRLAVWISNKCLGGSGGSGNSGRRSSYEDEWDNDDDYYDRPARRRSGSAIPEPGLFKAMGIALLWFIVLVVVSLVVNVALGVGANGGRGGQGNPFGPGAGGRDPILALGASCFQLVFGFLVFAGLFTVLLPTTFPRALLVTVFFYLEYIALIILVVIAVFVFFAAAGGGGGFK